MSALVVSLGDELREIAGDVRRIGCGFRSDPETILTAKDDAVKRLLKLADRVQDGRARDGR